MDYHLASIDRQLRLQASVWRLQRIEGDTRTAKQQTLQRIDRLLDQRSEATRKAALPTRPLLATP